VWVDGGAGAEGVVPAGLECGLEVVAHAVGGVGVEATYAWHFVAEALLGEDLTPTPVRPAAICTQLSLQPEILAADPIKRSVSAGVGSAVIAPP
jgi:hypothetical protein